MSALLALPQYICKHPELGNYMICLVNFVRIPVQTPSGIQQMDIFPPAAHDEYYGMIIPVTVDAAGVVGKRPDFIYNGHFYCSALMKIAPFACIIQHHEQPINTAARELLLKSKFEVELTAQERFVKLARWAAENEMPALQVMKLQLAAHMEEMRNNA